MITIMKEQNRVDRATNEVVFRSCLQTPCLISRGGQVSVNVIVHVDALVYIASDCVFCSSEP